MKDATLNAILQIHFEEPDGGILAFLTGQVIDYELYYAVNFWCL
jgi:hypothetical protein